MVNFVLIIVVFNLTNSSTAVSGVVLSYTLPAVFLGLLAGAIVDRWDKKKILIITNILRAFLLLDLAFFHSHLLPIYAFSLGVFIVTQFFIPAETPMIPALVPKHMLLSANALFGMGVYGSVLLAYAFSGPAIIAFGETGTFIFLAICFFLASICITLIAVPKEGKQRSFISRLSFIGEIKSAVRLMVSERKIYHSLLLLSLSQVLVLILAVIGPGYATEILHISVDEFPLLFVTPAAIGMIVGGLIIGNYFHRFSKEKSATIGVFLSGLAMLFLPYGSNFVSDVNLLHFMIFFAFLLGFANALIFVPSNTIIQEETDDRVRGKIYGGLNAFVGLLSLLPIILVGALADIVGVAKVMSGIGIVIILIGVLRVIFRAKD